MKAEAERWVKSHWYTVVAAIDTNECLVYENTDKVTNEVNTEVGEPYRYKGWYVVCINYDRGDATYLIATDKSQVENADEWVGFETEEDAEAFEIAGNEGLNVEDPDEFDRFYEVSVASSADIDNE